MDIRPGLVSVGIRAPGTTGRVVVCGEDAGAYFQLSIGGDSTAVWAGLARRFLAPPAALSLLAGRGGCIGFGFGLEGSRERGDITEHVPDGG